jgi:uncharacterized protein YjbI with pentapeptide repeats
MPDYRNILAEGVNRWNAWRLENPQIKKPSLRGLRLDQLEGVSHLNNANFRGADLSKADLRGASLLNADLVGADLSNANLKGAILTGANFNGATLYQTNLTFAELGHAKLIRARLNEARFSHANMRNADFRRSDLSSAQFDHANLTNAKLKSVKALGTSFERAILTGVCIEEWHTSSATKLTDAVCDYIYLKEKQGERRPSDPKQVFRSGEFGMLFQKALETVDIIFTDGIDWQAFFQSFQELRSQYDHISVQAIEKKSGGAFVIRLEVPAEADKAAIESHAKELYEVRLQLQEQRYRAELQAKDGQISLYQGQLDFHRQQNTNLMEIVKTMAEKENQPTHQTIINAQTIGATHTGSGDITNFTQNINSNIEDITKLIASLRNAAQSLPEAQREEALVHLDDLQEDLSQPEKQKPNRLKTRLVALFAIASTASGVVVGATDFGNKVLDLSKKLGIELIQAPPNQQLPPSQSK